MKKTSVLFIILISVFIASCEKDDICVDGDTPLLVIGFFDITKTEETEKAVTKLRIVGEGKTVTVNTIADRTDLKTVNIPLRSNATTTTYSLIANSADDTNKVETGNTDTITFNYSTKEVYVSRACGYVVNFDDLSDNLQADTDNWIKKIEITNTLIENQAVTHVKIFH